MCDVITELLRGRDNLTDLEQNKRTLLFNTLGLPFTYFHGAFYTACFEVADDGFGKKNLSSSINNQLKYFLL